MFFGIKKKKIESFDTISFHTSGMRHSTYYDIVNKDGEAEITQYHVKYSEGEKERVVDKQAVCGADEIIKLLNDCGIMSWNGFHGKHPRGIKDGVMFRFDAKVNGGEDIHADGSQNYPKHYHDLADWLYGTLNKKES